MIPMIHTGLGPFLFLPLVLLLHKILLEQEIKSCKLVLPRRKPDLPKIPENLRDLTPRWPPHVSGGRPLRSGEGKGGPNYHCRQLSAAAPPFFPSWPARGKAGQGKPEERPLGFLKQIFDRPSDRTFVLSPSPRPQIFCATSRSAYQRYTSA